MEHDLTGQPFPGLARTGGKMSQSGKIREQQQQQNNYTVRQR